MASQSSSSPLPAGPPSGETRANPNTHFPTSAHPADNIITQSGFRITTRKLPILKAGPIEEMTQKLGIAPPEMIFGDNFARIEHARSGWGIEFNAFDALDRVDKTGEAMLKVSYSKEWQKNRQHHSSDIKEVVKPFDWSYTTDYAGTTISSQRVPASATAAGTTDPPTSSPPIFHPTQTPIPLHLLKRPDPILFFDDVTLYEDELADNGIALLSSKIRVMPARLLLLTRFFLRLDDVLFRIRDVRVYVEFATGEVIREYTAREEKFADVKRRVIGMGNNEADALAIMRDPNQLSEFVPVVERRLEGLITK